MQPKQSRGGAAALRLASRRPGRDNRAPMASAPLPDADRLRHLARRFGGATIALVGDLAADVYLSGETHRVSREAPVLIVRQTESFVVPGQAGNVARNVAELHRGEGAPSGGGGGDGGGGGAVRLVAAVGRDAEGERLVERLAAAGVAVEGVVRAPAPHETNTKTRILAGGTHTRRQQIVRIDRDQALPDDPRLAAALLERALEAVAGAGAVVVSDYGYGIVTEALWQALREACRAASIPLLLDSRHRLGDLRGADVVTPNYEEALELAGHRAPAPRPTKRRLAAACRERAGAGAVVLKCGNEGMAVLGEDAPDAAAATLFGVHGAEEPVDVSGAGDTVAAVLALALAAGATLVEAAHLANVAAGIAVSKIGAATVSPAEIDAALAAWPSLLRAPREA